MNYGIQVVNVPSAINIRKVRCVAFFFCKAERYVHSKTMERKILLPEQQQPVRWGCTYLMPEFLMPENI